MLRKLILIGVAGAAGALARYALSGAAQRTFGGQFPWGTLVVNMVGCLLAGFLWSAFEQRVSVETRTIALTGFVGAFTTFATYALETGRMVQDTEWAWAGANIAAQNVFGLAEATVLRGILGYGAHSRIHTAKVLRLSEDLPIVIEIVDREDRIESFLPVLDEMITEGMVTLEKVRVLAYREGKG